MFSIKKIIDSKSPEIEIICNLAQIIWKQHYASIISMEQIEYMLNRFQSKTAITNQIENEDFIYYIAYVNNEPAGYSGIILKPHEHAVFLSKLYVLKDFRRMGISRLLLSDIMRDYPRSIYHKIYLTCNKYNDGALKAYQKMGFEITDSVVNSIGSGMVMDDFVMTLNLPL